MRALHVLSAEVPVKTKAELKPIADQVVVITGASSGIGLATAQLAARRGARVVLSGWDEEALERAAAELRAEGHRAVAAPADVTDAAALHRVADMAIASYGRIDAWINNAGIHIFGEVMETSEEDMRRIVDVNYWGVVHGSLAAIPHLARSGGALLNMASVLSSRSVPLQGIYTASKHAVKAITDALRVELEHRGAPIAVTMIAPSAIHTPIVEHSKNLRHERAQLPFPLYDPEVAARAIVRACEKPRREVIIGGAGFVAVTAEKLFPNLTDRMMELFFFRMQRARGEHREVDALHAPPDDPTPRVRSEDRRLVLRHSVYTWATFHPLLAALGLGGIAWWARSRLQRRRGVSARGLRSSFDHVARTSTSRSTSDGDHRRLERHRAGDGVPSGA